MFVGLVVVVTQTEGDERNGTLGRTGMFRLQRIACKNFPEFTNK